MVSDHTPADGQPPKTQAILDTDSIENTATEFIPDGREQRSGAEVSQSGSQALAASALAANEDISALIAKSKGIFQGSLDQRSITLQQVEATLSKKRTPEETEELKRKLRAKAKELESKYGGVAPSHEDTRTEISVEADRIDSVPNSPLQSRTPSVESLVNIEDGKLLETGLPTYQREESDTIPDDISVHSSAESVAGSIPIGDMPDPDDEISDEHADTQHNWDPRGVSLVSSRTLEEQLLREVLQNQTHIMDEIATVHEGIRQCAFSLRDMNNRIDALEAGASSRLDLAPLHEKLDAMSKSINAASFLSYSGPAGTTVQSNAPVYKAPPVTTESVPALYTSPKYDKVVALLADTAWSMDVGAAAELAGAAEKWTVGKDRLMGLIQQEKQELWHNRPRDLRTMVRLFTKTAILPETNMPIATVAATVVESNALLAAKRRLGRL